MSHLNMEPYYRRQQKDVVQLFNKGRLNCSYNRYRLILSYFEMQIINFRIWNLYILLLVSLDEYGIQRICFVFYLNINCVDKFLFINEAFNHIIIYFPIKTNMKFFSLSCMTLIIFNLFLSGSKNRSIWRVLSPRSNTSVAYFAQIPRIWWTSCESTSFYIRHFSNKPRQCLQQAYQLVRAFTAPSTAWVVRVLLHGLCLGCACYWRDR